MAVVSNDSAGAPRLGGDVLVTAWRAVQSLDPGTSTRDDRAGINAVVREHGHAEIARAMILLLSALLDVLAEDVAREPGEQADATDAASDDALSVVFPPLMRQLRRRFPELASGSLPMIAGVLTAALTGQDAVAWRDEFGAPDQPELASLTCLLWLVRDFFDAATGKGQADAMIAEIFEADQLQPR